MTTLEKKANDFKKAIHGKLNKKHNCMFFCVVSASGALCQIQAKRGGETITQQTIPWKNLEDVKPSEIPKLGNQTLIAMGHLLAFANA